MEETIMRVCELTKVFPISQGRGLRLGSRQSVRAADAVNLAIEDGETMGLVGESGCGKSTLGRLILRLLDPTSGQIIFRGKDITHLKGNALRNVRKDMQIILQNPYAALNPRRTIAQSISLPLRSYGVTDRDTFTCRVLEMLSLVGLDSGLADRFPHQLSGGQRQRVSIARALVLNPKFVVLDEPISALDVSVQAQVLRLLHDLKTRLKLSYLFISHDINVVGVISNKIAVMYLGKICEFGEAQDLLERPCHPYTAALASAVSVVEMDGQTREILVQGDPTDPCNLPSGCRFQPRCPKATDYCRRQEPQLTCVDNNRWVACLLYK
jgi:oligopeptide/dipeptide ABC transporter ATP-binding protein